MDLNKFSESDGLPQIEKVWDLDVNELVIEPKPFARGAFSQVYKGEYFGTKICVKMLKGDDAELLKFTCREISSLKFNHPNCVQFIGVAERNDEILIATEYVAGGNLRHYLKDSSVVLPWELRITIALDIASGMAFLHSKNVIHRDLKSKNLLVGDNWRIKVCDFGFARSIPNRRQVMTVCGTNDWMAPEIILGHPYDAKADVFSFGMVLVELITRRKVGEDVRRGPETHYRVDEDLLRSYVPKDTPPNLLELTLQCCAYDSHLRPSFKEITKMLKSMLKKKEERTISPFYGVVPTALHADPTPSSPSRRPKSPKRPSKQINHTTSTNTNHTFSLSALGAVLPSSSSTKKEKTRAGFTSAPPPAAGWTNSWDTATSSSSSPATHGNPLYQPRMFADVVLTDSHPRRDVEREGTKKSFNRTKVLLGHESETMCDSNEGQPDFTNCAVAVSVRDSPTAPLSKRPSNSGNKKSRR